MSFNPDLNLAEKVIFSWKMTKSFHSQICFNIYISAEIYLNKKLNLLSYLVRNFQINARNKVSAFSTFSHYIMPHLETWWLSLFEK